MLSTIAAFVAAGAAVIAALINVVLTARFTQRVELEAWRRERIHPLVVAMQTASWHHETKSDLLLLLREPDPGLSPEIQNRMRFEFRADANRASDDMSVALAELELVAPPTLVLAARALRLEHVGFHVAEDLADKGPSREKVLADVARARQTFVSTARRELGVPEGRPSSWFRVPSWLRRSWTWLETLMAAPRVDVPRDEKP